MTNLVQVKTNWTLQCLRKRGSIWITMAKMTEERTLASLILWRLNQSKDTKSLIRVPSTSISGLTAVESHLITNFKNKRNNSAKINGTKRALSTLKTDSTMGIRADKATAMGLNRAIMTTKRSEMQGCSMMNNTMNRQTLMIIGSNTNLVQIQVMLDILRLNQNSGIDNQATRVTGKHTRGDIWMSQATSTNSKKLQERRILAIR